MPTKNHGRMAQDMKRELIAIIGEMKDPRVTGGLLTVTRLDVTPDLDQAKVYISVMGREGGPEPVAMSAPRSAAGCTSARHRALYSSKMKAQPMPRTSISCWVSWTLSLTLTQSKAPQLEKRNL